MHLVMEVATHTLGEPKTVTRIARRRKQDVVLASGEMAVDAPLTRWPSRSTIAPETRPFSITSSTTGDDSHSGIPRAKAFTASLATKALPLTRRVPRLWRSRSRAWRANMRPTYSADLADWVILKT